MYDKSSRPQEGKLHSSSLLSNISQSVNDEVLCIHLLFFSRHLIFLLKFNISKNRYREKKRHISSMSKNVNITFSARLAGQAGEYLQKGAVHILITNPALGLVHNIRRIDPFPCRRSASPTYRQKELASPPENHVCAPFRCRQMLGLHAEKNQSTICMA